MSRMDSVKHTSDQKDILNNFVKGIAKVSHKKVFKRRQTAIEGIIKREMR